MAAQAEMRAPEAPRGSYYCSTSGTVFEDIQSLTQHYKSDFHRYNLKRKVAGLPPVTREWFEARKSQLALASNKDTEQKIWIDPLTQKKFSSENTYLAHTRSKKFKDLVRKSGQPAPVPIIVGRKQHEDNDAASVASTPSLPVTGVWSRPHPQAHVSLPFKSANMTKQPSLPDTKVHDGTSVRDKAQDEDEDEEEAGQDDGSEWETDDGEDVEGQEAWEEWDVCASLFDGHVSPSFGANLQYMQRHFGFTLPEEGRLRDPQGLLRYLGAKLQYGKVPLYARGDDPSVKQFRSLHAVQRHMVDTNQCKLLWTGNEEEYEDYYGDGEGEEEEEVGEEGQDPGSRALIDSAAAAAAPAATGGYELVVAAGSGGGSKLLGTREFRQYYRQRHRPEDSRQSVAINTFVAKYRALALSAQQDREKEKQGRESKATAHRAAQQVARRQLGVGLRANKLNNLPNNVPY